MIQQAKLAYDWGYVHLMRDPAHRKYTHTIEADFTAANTVTFSLFALVWCRPQYGVVGSN